MKVDFRLAFLKLEKLNADLLIVGYTVLEFVGRNTAKRRKTTANESVY